MNKTFNKKKRDIKTINDKLGANTRACAALIVNAIEQGTSLTDALPKFTDNLDARDKAFVTEIVYGTLRHKRLLSATLDRFLEKKINEKFNVVRTLILCALYQLVYMRTPAHAVVSSTVSACGICKCKNFTSLVNAILRNFLRSGASIVHTDNLVVEHSFPQWLFDFLEKEYKKDVKDILIKSNEKAPMFLRIRENKISEDDYIKELQKHDIEATKTSIKNAILLDKAVATDTLPFFNEGFVTVQDISAQKASLLLDLKDNMKVLDCCAAPGGKSAHILDLAKNIELTSLDVSKERLKSIEDQFKRLSLNANLICQDAQDLSIFQDESFDRILVDAPCSGTGVIRRHPDIKWLRRKNDISNLVQIQEKILDAAFSKLKKNGILVYTTCSILPYENRKQIEKFLEKHKDAKGMPLSLFNTDKCYYQLITGEDNGDGFFYAKIMKI